MKKKKQKKKKKKKIKKKTENKKGIFEFTGLDKKRYRITLQEKRFAELYLEFYGNGTNAAWEVYRPKNKEVAAAIAYEYLRKPHIFAYVNLKLKEYGYSDEGAKKQHLFLLNQHANFLAKAKAVDMFFKTTGEYAPIKFKGEMKHKIDPTNEQWNRLRKLIIGREGGRGTKGSSKKKAD